MTVTTSSARHLLVRSTQPARLPEAILAALRDEVVLAGWMRGSGVLSEVQLRIGASGAPRRISGVVHVISLEGSIGLSSGDVSCGMRAVLARETESGLETIAGEIVDARIEAFEAWITAFDDVTATRQLDAAGAWVLDATAGLARPAPAAAPPPAPSPAAAPAPPPPAAAAPAPAPAPAPAFSDVVRAAEAAERPAPPPPPAPEPPRPAAPKPSPTFSSMSQTIPQRITRPVVETEDEPVPEPGDVVEHFAFGRCEVVKTDGDRLHVRLSKDQRIKEIALEMLKVTALPLEEGQTTRHWKLARKL